VGPYLVPAAPLVHVPVPADQEAVANVAPTVAVDVPLLDTPVVDVLVNVLRDRNNKRVIGYCRSTARMTKKDNLLMFLFSER
jgi:hypothetical protein